MSSPRQWDAAEDRLLCEMLAAGEPYAQAAGKLGRTIEAVRVRTKMLRQRGVPVESRNVRWTPELDRRLVGLVRDGVSNRQIAATLNLTYGQVQGRVQRLRQQGAELARRPGSTLLSVETEERLLSLARAGAPRKQIAAEFGLTSRQAIDLISRLRAHGVAIPDRRRLWNVEMDERLIGLALAGVPYEQVAQELDLTVKQVQARIGRLRTRGVQIPPLRQPTWQPSAVTRRAGEMAIAGASSRQIAAEFGLTSRQAIALISRLRAHGVAIPDRRRLWNVEMDERLIGLALAGVPYEQVAQELNLTVNQVQRRVIWLRAHGVAIPDRRRLWNVEMDEQLRSLREQGLTYRQAADRLGVSVRAAMARARRSSVLRAASIDS